jgi:hypothetical protein
MFSKEKFVARLKQIKERDDQLTIRIELTRLTVNQHCLDLANDVDITTETRIEKSATKQEAIEKLNVDRKNLLKKIKDYEAGCMASVETTRSTLLESIQKTAKWAELMLQETSLARYDHHKDVLNEQAEKHLGNLDRIHLQLRAFQFGGKLMRFDESYDDESVGSLRYIKLIAPRCIHTLIKSGMASFRYNVGKQ